LRATTDTGLAGLVVKAESIRMNVDQPVALSQYAEWITPLGKILQLPDF
jgi:hypothetical protein